MDKCGVFFFINKKWVHVLIQMRGTSQLIMNLTKKKKLLIQAQITNNI